MDLKFIYVKFSVLNKATKRIASEENFLLFKMFIKEYNLNSRFKRADTPARMDISKLIRSIETDPTEPTDLCPYAY
jgi:hypothetical protein